MSDAVARLNAALDGRYTIERELGEGGMATVYLARDQKHNRNVALKVLKPELAAVVGADRFLAEIETTAGLQHPHILPLFDSGRADTFLFYVMPYVEGETLAEKLDREHQLPLDEAVRIATDVAEALNYAHSHGVIHRDIKPGNIQMQAGKAVVSDFGIALAVGAAGQGRMTETGLSLGTPHYMSPEQATGDVSVGPATDIYALGAVLFQMLVGRPPYTGTTAQAILGKIITGKLPSAVEDRASVPAHVDAVIRKALEKLPADRFRNGQALARALADPGFRHGEPAGVAPDRTSEAWKRVAAVLAVLFVASTVGLGWSLTRPEPAVFVERFASPFGEGDEPAYSAPGSFALSADGSILVYRGLSREQGNQLWLRRWDELEPSPIRETYRGGQPAVSPDGETVAFVQGGEIKVASASSGAVRTLTSGASPQWGPDGYVYATSDLGVVRVSGTGGPTERVAELADLGPGYGITDVLPDGTGALISMATPPGSDVEIRALRFETGEFVPLALGTLAQYAASGHLLYIFDGTLMAARFDAEALELRGSAVGLIEGVSSYTISDSGKLFYSRGAGQQLMEAVWVSRSGQVSPVEAGWIFDAGVGNWSWSLSPDGARVALRSTSEGNQDIWVKTLNGGSFSRLTLDEAEDWSPSWTPDGERVTFVSSRASGPSNRDAWIVNADGTGDPQLLYDHESTIVEALWGPTGEWLLLRTGASGAGENTRSILALRPGVDSVALPLLTEEYDEQQPALSPDGRWLAYISNETGPFELFLRPFPDVTSRKWQVTNGGGIMPVWARSGRELFYVDGNRDLVSLQIDATSDPPWGAREVLFRISSDYPTSDVGDRFDVAPGDQRFLMARFYRESGYSRFVLVNNFFEELRARIPN